MIDNNHKDPIQENLTAQILLYKELLQVTKRQDDFLKNHDIDRVLGCINERENIIENIKLLKRIISSHEETTEYNHKLLLNEIEVVIQSILDLDGPIQRLLDVERRTVGGKIGTIANGRKLSAAYNPTKSIDAFFFDKKK